jgi:hypothetical protein
VNDKHILFKTASNFINFDQRLVKLALTDLCSNCLSDDIDFF